MHESLLSEPDERVTRLGQDKLLPPNDVYGPGDTGSCEALYCEFVNLQGRFSGLKDQTTRSYGYLCPY